MTTYTCHFRKTLVWRDVSYDTVCDENIPNRFKHKFVGWFPWNRVFQGNINIFASRFRDKLVVLIFLVLSWGLSRWTELKYYRIVAVEGWEKGVGVLVYSFSKVREAESPIFFVRNVIIYTNPKPQPSQCSSQQRVTSNLPLPAHNQE